MKRTLLLTFIALIATLIGVVVIGIRTEPVRKWMGAYASRKLSEATGMQVDIKRIVPTLPFRYVIEDLSVMDGDEKVLEAEFITVVLRPSAMLSKTLSFAYVGSKKITVFHKGPPPVSDELFLDQPEDLQWPSSPIGFSIALLEIEELAFAGGMAMAVTGSLDVDAKGDDFDVELRVKRLDIDIGTFVIEVEGKAETKDIFAEVRTLSSEEDSIQRGLATAGIIIKAFEVNAYGKLDSWAAVLAGKGGAPDQQLLGDFSLVVATEPASQSIASRLVGKRALLEGVFMVDGKQNVRLKPLSGEGQRMRVNGELLANLSGKIQSAHLDLVVKDLSALNDIARLDYQGSLLATVDVTGTATEPTLIATLNSERITANDITIEDLSGKVEVTFKEGARGRADLTGRANTIPLNATMDLASDDYQCWRFDNLQVEAGTTRLIGDARICREAGVQVVHLTGEVGRLANWAPIIKLDIEGNGRVEITYEAEDEHLLLEAETPILVLGQFLAENAKVHLDLMRPFKDPVGEISLDANKLIHSRVTFYELDFSTELGGETWPFVLSWEAIGGHLDGAEARGRWHWSKELFVASLESFDGHLFDEEVELLEPLTVQWSDQLTISPFAMRAGSGTLKLAYAPNDALAPLDMEAYNFPLSVLEVIFPNQAMRGTLDGTVSLANIDRNPTGVIDLRWNDVELKDPLILDVTAVQGWIDGKLEGGRLKLTSSVDSAASSPLTAKADIPLEITGPPLAWRLPDEAKISGDAVFAGDLAPLLQFLIPDTIQISGDVVADAELTGTVGEPHVTGKLLVRDGTFEDLYSGGRFTDLNARLVADGSELVLEALSANDGHNGSLTAVGKVELEPLRDYPFQIELKTNNAQLIDLDIATARFTGDLSFGGTLIDPSITGALTSNFVRINLEKDLPPSTPTLKVTYVNVPPSLKKQTTRPHLVDIDLDIDLTVTGDARMDGRGIKSQWAGEGKLTGTIERPEINGQLDLVRGTFDLAGRDFKLTKGVIRFDGPPETHTHVDMVGTLGMQDVEINAELEGTLPRMTLTFYSAPYMGEQEILSYVLFGGPLTGPSPGQEAQLEQASYEIGQGNFGGGDLLTSLPRTIGLDELTVTSPTGATEEYGILAGKKITEDFEVHVYRSVNQEFNRTRIELALFRHFYIAGETGNEDSERFSLLWKTNY